MPERGTFLSQFCLKKNSSQSSGVDVARHQNLILAKLKQSFAGARDNGYPLKPLKSIDRVCHAQSFYALRFKGGQQQSAWPAAVLLLPCPLDTPQHMPMVCP
jgi:hypothetical protein